MFYYPNGRETTVSMRSLAPRGQSTTEVRPVKPPPAKVQLTMPPPAEAPKPQHHEATGSTADFPDKDVNHGTGELEQSPIALRRSQREHRPIDGLNTFRQERMY